MLAIMRGTGSLPITQSQTKSAPLSTLELKLIKLNQQISKTFLTRSLSLYCPRSLHQFYEAWTLNKCQSKPIKTEPELWSLRCLSPTVFRCQPPVSSPPGVCQHWHQPWPGRATPGGPVTLHTDTGGEREERVVSPADQTSDWPTLVMERKMSWIWQTVVD